MELYEHHDNYKLVGRLREDNLAEGEPEDGTEADAAEWELKRKASLTPPLSPPPLPPPVPPP